MKKLNQYIFNYTLRHAPHLPVLYRGWEDVRSIIILYESDFLERNQSIKDLARSLQQEGKHITILGWSNKQEITSANLPQSRILCKKDFNFFSAPKSEIIDELQSRKHDLLLDLTQQPCLPMLYLALYIQADFKVGRHIVDGIHNLFIDMPPQEDQMELCKQMLHYLKMLKTAH